MQTSKFSRFLDQVIHDQVPEAPDLAPQILQQASARQHKTVPHLKAASIVLAAAALFLVSSVGYAVYHLVIDPGLENVQNAGLVSNQGTTALPIQEPTAKATLPPKALMVGQSQTVEGFNMALDWVYLDNTTFLSGLSFDTLPKGISLGFPIVYADGKILGENQQSADYLRITTVSALYLSHQVTQTPPESLEIEVPLLREVDGKVTSVASFHFKVDHVALYPGQSLPLQQTTSVSVGGAEIQLHAVRLNSSLLEATLCTASQSTEPLAITEASLTDSSDSIPHLMSSGIKSETPSCQILTFDAQGLDEAGPLTLTVNRDWQFIIDQPSLDQIPGVTSEAPKPSATPLSSQSIDNLNVTLDWVFTDAKRIALGYTISGFSSLPDSFVLGGTMNVKDAQGNTFGRYSGQSILERVPDRPDAVSGTWSAILQQPLTTDQIDLSIDLTLDGSHGNDWNFTLGGPVYPLSGPTEELIGETPAVIPGNLVGTYHFNTSTKVYPIATLNPGQVVESNGIQMELVQAELTPSYSNFILCYTKPSAADWTLANATLTVGLDQVNLSSYSLLSDAQYILKNQASVPSHTLQGENLRCVSVDFLLGTANKSQSFTLTIPGLERSTPEVFPQAELAAALAKLHQEGIDMTYISMSGTGGGGTTWKYDRLPDGMTEMQAYNRLKDVLGYSTPGSWTFTFEAQR